ncbi:high frequency lysogenization protein HflD [Buchnera aphidicola (Pemphigus obesinymphae)]|uniref:high frequency lysogenization protein HflD n=1 Tax=Buchnera aphidicola TaxID=9 RepID=UPI002238FB9B|nr:high frequency lysogenization protein HflD [Buchnera aphidicola]MCW5196498.1 high frequency lysogenization protein HflD [Buchnera aphidicola (Pemphigus obesinymphae)]
MIKNIHSVTLSLAGLCQSAYLVYQLSQTGNCDDEAFKVNIESILNMNPKTVLSVYGNDEKKLNLGLNTLLNILNITNSTSISFYLIKYIFGIMVLERKLTKNKIALKNLSYRLEIIKKNTVRNIETNDINLINDFSEIYLDIISTLGSRIKIVGASAILKKIEVQSKLRSILLAGIRSAVLWRQVGGNRLQLIFFRNRFNTEVKRILVNIK